MYNVKSWRFRVTILQWESNLFVLMSCSVTIKSVIKYLVLHNNAYQTNLICRQKQGLLLGFFSCKALNIFVRYETNLDFLDSFPKMYQISDFTEIRPVRIALIHADLRTDRLTDKTKVICAFRGLWERAYKHVGVLKHVVRIKDGS